MKTSNKTENGMHIQQFCHLNFFFFNLNNHSFHKHTIRIQLILNKNHVNTNDMVLVHI